MNRFLLLAAAATIASTVPASAQSFNLDMGTWNAAPSATFGAAANQPGTWNQIDCNFAGPIALVDLAGASTGVTIERTGGNGANFHHDHPGTSGEDHLLLDDAEDLIAPSTWTISGLAAGAYEVTTYAWAPDGADFYTNVSVNNGPASVVGGGWFGTYVLGAHYARDTVSIAAGEPITITVSVALDYATFNGVQLRHPAPSFAPMCFGDGTGAQCPCGNTGSLGHGCANSVFLSGGLLTGSGSASVASDTVVLGATDLAGASAVFFQGDVHVAPVAIDDGLGCVGGVIVRLGTKSVTGGASAFPGPGDPLVSVRGALPPAGGLRHYQCFYRNASALFCQPATSNRTNGVTVTWSP